MSIKKEYYSADLAEFHLHYYSGLGEKNQRHFLGMEYLRLGRGSQRYLSTFYRCSRHRIALGVSEIAYLRASSEAADYSRQRKAGGGAKKKR